MKKIGFIFAFAILNMTVLHLHDASAQDTEIKTLLSDSTPIGGYVGLNMEYNQIVGRDGMAIGARAGWIVGHSLAIGVTGSGFFTEAKPSDMYYGGGSYNYGGGYAGLFIEPILLAKFPVHISFPVTLGFGKINFYDDLFAKQYDEEYEKVIDSDSYFMAQPGAEVELNVFKNFRLAFGVNYRFTSAIDLFDPASSATEARISPQYPLNTLNAGITFKFGAF